MPEPGYWTLHEEACARGEDTYRDPETGYQVFTRIGLRKRERCCGVGCRHCPFDHEQVRTEDRADRIQQAAWLTRTRPAADPAARILFWSGGKDSYLAYLTLAAEADTPIVLLTTFDARSRIIAHQEMAIAEVVAQAEHLGLPLIGVPLQSGPDYLDQVAPALALVPGCSGLCFGDLHLTHIRSWREEAFRKHPATSGMQLSFPLWQQDYALLLAKLAASGAICAISAVRHDLESVSVGDIFDANCVAKLPRGIDAFGENGEFHTRVTFDQGS
ncbi:DUF5522 domain-containing protein [Erythrobacter aureus]|uniref:Diphthamide synthase domain-containing protein n=1 Tax=Erythrobacter aureus TaxID=2182384 RepID=A0A345YEE0_9SPHN|nr:DUF5522 domain-containing protein [Erythrobacter aureus]AXK42292.1 hypothetical protein DVR09_08020 [Erythrobacter aureus]